MFPGRYPGWLAHREPIQRHTHIKAIGSGGTKRPRPPARRPWPRKRAVVRVQPLPAFTISGMWKARKGSTERSTKYQAPGIREVPSFKFQSVVVVIVIGACHKDVQVGVMRTRGAYRGCIILAVGYLSAMKRRKNLSFSRKSIARDKDLAAKREDYWRDGPALKPFPRLGDRRANYLKHKHS